MAIWDAFNPHSFLRTPQPAEPASINRDPRCTAARASTESRDAFSLPILVVDRVLVAVVVRLGSLLVPLYIFELAPKEIRGKLVVTSVPCITFGQLLAYVIGISLALPFLPESIAWRTIL
jgi:MFS family permease